MRGSNKPVINIMTVRVQRVWFYAIFQQYNGGGEQKWDSAIVLMQGWEWRKVKSEENCLAAGATGFLIDFTRFTRLIF